MKITLQSAYATLGVSHGASEEEARSAYRKLALKFHPDKNPDTDTTVKFQEISAAYKRVCDHHKRQRATGNQGGSFFDDGDEDDDDFDDEDFAFDDIDLEDLELSFEEMIMMFEMMFGPAGKNKKKTKNTVNIKKTTAVTAPSISASTTARKTAESGVKVPVRAAKARNRKGKRRGAGGMNDDDMAAAFASFMDPEMMMFEQFMGMSMDDPDMGGMDAAMMDEMMEMLAGDDLFGVKEIGKKRKNKRATGKARQQAEDEEEVEEVSDWEDDPAEAKLTAPLGGNQVDHVSAVSDIPLNSRVRITNKLVGTVKFIGPVHYTKGDFVGVQLDEPEGKNDGTVRGVAYFKCKPLHGLMVRPQEVTIISTPASHAIE